MLLPVEEMLAVDPRNVSPVAPRIFAGLVLVKILLPMCKEDDIVVIFHRSSPFPTVNLRTEYPIRFWMDVYTPSTQGYTILGKLLGTLNTLIFGLAY